MRGTLKFKTPRACCALQVRVLHNTGTCFVRSVSRDGTLLFEWLLLCGCKSSTAILALTKKIQHIRIHTHT